MNLICFVGIKDYRGMYILFQVLNIFSQEKEEDTKGLLN